MANLPRTPRMQETVATHAPLLSYAQDPNGGSNAHGDGIHRLLSERSSMMPNSNALEGGNGDTITSGNASTVNVANSSCGNVIAPTSTEFGTQPPSDIQSPTSFHIPSAGSR